MTAIELAWYGCDLKTGAIAEELRALRPTQPLSRRLGAITSTSFELDLAGAPQTWEQATDPARTLLVAVDTGTALPVWSGIPLPRSGGSDPTVSLTAATPEAYLDRRYAAYSGKGVDRTTVMTQIAQPLLSQGPPIVLDTTASGSVMDYTVADSEDRTVLSCLQELAAMNQAPEWTIDTVWADAAQTQVQLVLRIRPAIGVQTTTPEAVFDMPGCITTYTLTESFERGKGANRVTARGDQAATGRATSTAHTANGQLNAGWCLWEHRWTPASGITDTAQLERHATQALALMQGGSRAWSIQAAASTAPRLGDAWALGDSVRIQITTSPRHPTGIETVARAYAWSLDPAADRLSPILLEDDQ